MAQTQAQIHAQTQTLPAPAVARYWSLFRHRADTAEATLRFAGAQWRRFKAWRERRAALAELRMLDDALLKDIGLHRSHINAMLLEGAGQGRRIDATRHFLRSY